MVFFLFLSLPFSTSTSSSSSIGSIHRQGLRSQIDMDFYQIEFKDSFYMNCRRTAHNDDLFFYSAKIKIITRGKSVGGYWRGCSRARLRRCSPYVSQRNTRNPFACGCVEGTTLEYSWVRWSRILNPNVSCRIPN